jgi:hypothetical protein
VFRYAAILFSAVVLASAGALGAQEIKPRSTPTSTTMRLPKPSSISAAQQPDGRIRVVWSAVEGAARYKLIRSVPPNPSSPVTLPNAPDTQYVDADVKPGSSYYYLVSAVDEAGMEGLKAGSAPVVAKAVAPIDTAPAPATVPPPTDVTVKMYDYMRPEVRWRTSVPGARAVIERREHLNGMVAGSATWQPAVTLSSRSWPCSSECSFIDERSLKTGASVEYRVTVVEADPSTRKSEPVTSNSVFVEHLPTEPPEIHFVWLLKGESQQLPSRPGTTGFQYASLDTNLVSVPNPGVIRAKEWGETYVTAFTRTAEGSIKFWLWKVRVLSTPR